MTNFSQNNVQLVMVGKDVAKTTTTIAALNDGEIGLFTPGGTMYTESTADAGDQFQIVLGRGSSLQPLKSPVFSKADVTRVTRKAYAAGSVQLDYIGFNGSTGSIAVSNNTVYRATINVIESPETTNGGVLVKDMVYSSDAGATQAEIADGLFKSVVGNFSRQVEKGIGFEMLMANGSDTAVPTSADNFVFTNGSKTISATDIDDATGTAALAVGDYLRIGTGATDEVYRIVSINATANTAELSVPFQGTTQTLADTALKVIVAASAASVATGIKLTGLTMDWSNGKITNKLSRWVLNLDSSSFGATTLTNSTTPSFGTGSYRQVAELEYFANGNTGEIFRSEAKNNFAFTPMSSSAETYDAIEIELVKGRSGIIATSQPQVITLFVDSGKDTSGHYALAATTDDITDMLEDLLDGVPIYGGTTANGGALTTNDLALT